MINEVSNEKYKSIGIDNNIKFGLEIEAENIKKSKIKGMYNKELWKVKTDPTLKPFNNVEFSSIPFTDNPYVYKSIDNICNLLILNNANLNENSSLQIHYDASIFNDKFDSILYFYKMWCIFENIIYRYSYGENILVRRTLNEFSSMISKVFNDADEKGILFNNYDVSFTNGKIDKDLVNYSKIIGSSKRYGFSFRYNNLYGIYTLKTIEIRTMNSTSDLLLIKNYLKFFYSLLKYCGDNPDKEYIDYLYKNTNLLANNVPNSLLIDYEKAQLLSDLIFVSDYDKENFMNIYLKENCKVLSRGLYA